MATPEQNAAAEAARIAAEAAARAAAAVQAAADAQRERQESLISRFKGKSDYDKKTEKGS